MPSAVFLFEIALSTAVIATTFASSLRCISCSCGSGSLNYTHCFDESLHKDLTCEWWSQCHTCKANTTFCITCPSDRFGPTCSKSGHTRKKRQEDPDLLNHPNYPRRSGSCPSLERPELGSMRCSQTGNERYCTSRCLPGYQFEGEENVKEITLRCRRGIWTPRRFFPSCKSEGHCELNVTGAGFYDCAIDIQGTHCDITCDGWYQGRFHCYPGRPWNPPLPFCTVPREKTQCRCQNGGVCGVNGKCMCPEGRTGTYCENLERQKATCPDPGIPRDGSRLNPNGSDASYRRVFEEGESVIFSCNGESSALQGKSLITCLADGTWSDPLPQCITSRGGGDTAYCPDPGYIEFGSRINADGSDSVTSSWYTDGQSVVYYCLEEYELVGNSILTCLSSGQWSSNKPFCKRIGNRPTEGKTNCRHPGVDINGIIEDHPLLDPRIRGQTFPPGTELKFDCKDGFKPKGAVILSCMRYGEWSSAPPTCERSVTTTPGGKINCRHPGVDINGIIEDHPLLDPRIRGQTFPPGTELKFDCKEGFQIEGAVILYCMSFGEWSSEPPTCTRRDTTTTERPTTQGICRHPGHDVNGRIEGEFPANPQRKRFPVGTELKFSCDAGFEPEGATTIVCRSSGQWTSIPPKCRKIVTTTAATTQLCPLPEVDPNAEVEEFFSLDPRKLQGFEPGSKLNFNCKEGHDMQGPRVIECLGNGRWSSSPPTCNPVSRNPGTPIKFCPLLEVNPNVEVDEFFVLDPRKSQGFEPGDKLNFNCKEGHDLEGPSVIECLGNGRWSSSPPTCNPKSRDPDTPSVGELQLCPTPEVDPNGEVVEWLQDPWKWTLSFEPDTELTFRCKEGYVLQGWDTIRCRSNGQWSNPSPKCNVKQLSNSGTAYFV